MRFYDIHPTMGSKWYWAKLTTDVPEKYLCNGMRGFKRCAGFEIIKGTTRGDFLWNGSLLRVVSEKVLSIWNRYKSFSTYDVEVTSKRIPLKYFGISVTGHGGSLNFRKSNARYYTEKSGTRVIMSLNGLYFDEAKWDGSDIMYLDEYPLGCLISERVTDEMKRAKVTSCEYIPIEEVAF